MPRLLIRVHQSVLVLITDCWRQPLTVGEPHSAIPALLEYLKSQQRPLARLTTRQVSLEDVFVSLTGRTLRDE